MAIVCWSYEEYINFRVDQYSMHMDYGLWYI